MSLFFKKNNYNINIAFWRDGNFDSVDLKTNFEKDEGKVWINNGVLSYV